MLSNKDAEILYLVKSNRANEVSDFDTFGNLCNLNFISYTGAGFAYVTPEGERALKEYEIAHENLKAEKESVQIARKANCISEESNKQSRRAYILSVISLIASSLISITALFLTLFVR